MTLMTQTHLTARHDLYPDSAPPVLESFDDHLSNLDKKIH